MYSINQDDNIARLATAIIMREQEINSYDMNISNYEAALAVLPGGDWPADLVQYQSVPLTMVPDELDQTVSELQFRDHLRSLLKTERAERAKSNLIYAAMLSQIPATDRDAVMAAAVSRLKTP